MSSIPDVSASEHPPSGASALPAPLALLQTQQQPHAAPIVTPNAAQVPPDSSPAQLARNPVPSRNEFTVLMDNRTPVASSAVQAASPPPPTSQSSIEHTGAAAAAAAAAGPYDDGALQQPFGHGNPPPPVVTSSGSAEMDFATALAFFASSHAATPLGRDATANGMAQLTNASSFSLPPPLVTPPLQPPTASVVAEMEGLAASPAGPGAAAASDWNHNSVANPPNAVANAHMIVQGVPPQGPQLQALQARNAVLEAENQRLTMLLGRASGRPTPDDPESRQRMVIAYQKLVGDSSGEVGVANRKSKLPEMKGDLEKNDKKLHKLQLEVCKLREEVAVRIVFDQTVEVQRVEALATDERRRVEKINAAFKAKQDKEEREYEALQAKRAAHANMANTLSLNGPSQLTGSQQPSQLRLYPSSVAAAAAAGPSAAASYPSRHHRKRHRRSRNARAAASDSSWSDSSSSDSDTEGESVNTKDDDDEGSDGSYEADFVVMSEDERESKKSKKKSKKYKEDKKFKKSKKNKKSKKSRRDD